MQPGNNSDFNEATPIDNIFLMRLRLLRGMLIFLTVLGLPAIVFACIEALKLGQTGGAVLYGLIYLLFLATTLFFHRLPFVFCAVVMLGSLYLISLFNFVGFSFAGAGIELSLTISVLATVLLGIRSGLVTAAICFFSLIVIGLCFVYGVFTIGPEMPSTTSQIISWITAAAVFATLAGSLVLSSGMLQEHLIRSVAVVQSKTEELKEANEDLTQENRQRKAAEDKLKQSEERFKTLFEMAPDAIYLTDMEGTFIDLNHTTEALMGIPKDSLIGKKFTNMGILEKTEIPKLSALLEKNIRGESTGPDELTINTKEGDSITVEILTSPFKFEDRQLVLTIARDISARKRLESRLNQSQKMESIGTLAGGIAHDFNNILSGIFGYSHLAQIHMGTPEKANAHIEQIVNGAKRAAELTRQILTFSRQSEYQKQPFKIYLEIKEALKLLRSSIPANIEIKTKLDSTQMVLADPIKIHQVIMNLCTNAYHAMRKTGGCLTVSLTDVEFSGSNFLRDKEIVPGDYIELEVSDTGHGMDETILKRAFDPYFTTKEKGDGTGLGLALVQAIVEEHDGFWKINSEPGKGTSVYLYFPIVRGKIKENIPKVKKESHLTGNETIMVVDDEDPIRKICKKLFEHNGYQVETFSNGIDALEAFKTHPDKFDLIITDMTMPGFTGDKLSTQILNIKPDIPIILCTGFNENISQADAIELGIKKFILKPILNQDLLVSVRKILDQL